MVTFHCSWWFQRLIGSRCNTMSSEQQSKRAFKWLSSLSCDQIFHIPGAGIVLCMCPANERRRYNVTSPLIGRAHAQNYPCRRPIHIFHLCLSELMKHFYSCLSELMKRFTVTCLTGNSTHFFMVTKVVYELDSTDTLSILVLPIDIENPYRLSNSLYR